MLLTPGIQLQPGRLEGGSLPRQGSSSDPCSFTLPIICLRAFHICFLTLPHLHFLRDFFYPIQDV